MPGRGAAIAVLMVAEGDSACLPVGRIMRARLGSSTTYAGEDPTHLTDEVPADELMSTAHLEGPPWWQAMGPVLPSTKVPCTRLAAERGHVRSASPVKQSTATTLTQPWPCGRGP